MFTYIYVNVAVAGAQLHVIITYSLFNGLPALNETIENYSKSFLLLQKKRKYSDRAMGRSRVGASFCKFYNM